MEEKEEMLKYLERLTQQQYLIQQEYQIYLMRLERLSRIMEHSPIHLHIQDNPNFIQQNLHVPQMEMETQEIQEIQETVETQETVEIKEIQETVVRQEEINIEKIETSTH